MKLLALGVLFVTVVGGLASPHVIPGAQIVPANDKSKLRNIGAFHQRYPDRRTVTIRSSKSDDDDVSSDFLWGIKQANHGGRLLLEKGKTYVIGKKLDLSFLNNIEVQLEGEIKVYFNKTRTSGSRGLTRAVYRQHHLLASEQLLLLFPEVDYLLGLGWSGHQDLRAGNSQW